MNFIDLRQFTGNPQFFNKMDGHSPNPLSAPKEGGDPRLHHPI